MGELGVVVKDGRLSFMPRILRKSLFLKEAGQFDFSMKETVCLSFQRNRCFTFCQIPIVYTLGKSSMIEVHSGGKSHSIEGESLDMVD